jgi:hypothetical protein
MFRQLAISAVPLDATGITIHCERPSSMSWLRSPVTLFGSAAVLLFLLMLFFPPAHFPGVLQAHIWANLLGVRMDMTGYGLYEFPAFVFALSSLAYYLTNRLTGRVLNRATVQLHFWPSFLFAMYSIFWAHLVNHIPADRLDAPEVQASLHYWLTAFMWAFVAFIAVQVVFAIGAVRRIWLHKRAVAQP